MRPFYTAHHHINDENKPSTQDRLFLEKYNYGFGVVFMVRWLNLGGHLKIRDVDL